jgi:hypothetical protein
MTEKELLRCKEFLKYFHIEQDDDTIYLNDGGNGCIMNPNTEWKDFLGYSINSVAIAVAKELGKKTKYVE